MFRKKRKSFLIALIVFCLLLSGWMVVSFQRQIQQIAGSTADDEKTYQYHFALVTDEDNNPYWDQVYEGTKKEAEEQDAYVEMTGSTFAEHYSLSQRLSMAIASRVDGIVILSDGSDTVRSLISQAAEGTMLKTIPVLTVMEDNSDTGRSGYVGINSYEQGQRYGELIMELYQTKNISHVTILSNYTQKSNDTGVYFGDIIYSSIREYLQNQVLDDAITLDVKNVNHASTFNSRRDIQMLLSGEDAPQVLICVDYLYTISACQVLVDRNLVGDVYILGSYVSDEILDYVQKGTLYASVATDPYVLGQNCMQTLLELNEYGHCNEYQTTDMMVITQNTIAMYREQLSEEEAS